MQNQIKKSVHVICLALPGTDVFRPGLINALENKKSKFWRSAVGDQPWATSRGRPVAAVPECAALCCAGMDVMKQEGIKRGNNPYSIIRSKKRLI